MTESPRLRLAVLALVTISLFGALLTRLWYLQVLAAPEYKVAAESNQVRLVPEPAPRGRILDRNGRVLVANRISRVVNIERELLRDDERDVVLARLSALLDLPVAVLEERLQDPRVSPYKPVPVAEDVPETVIIAIREHPELFPPEAVNATQVAVRKYPHGTLLAHVLGYVGETNDDELKARKKLGYRLGDEIGKTGVELAYERDLRGQPGLEKLEVDSQGRVLGVLGHRAPVQGNDVRLTIDIDIQRAAEQALLAGLEAARARVDRSRGFHHPAPAGSVVVLDPRDGAVLAMASYPTFSPELFVGGITEKEFAPLNNPANHTPLTNRALQGEYAPGSTFKLVTGSAALATGLRTPESTTIDRGSLRVGNRTFRNAGGAAYGPVAMARAVSVSSDVFFYEIGRDFWEQRDRYGDGIQKWARNFGFDKRTGIELPYEQDGRIPTPERRRQLHERYPEAFPEGDWFTGDNVNLAIGQGEVVVTPLQLATAYGTFANGGTRWIPHLASKVLTQGGDVVRTIKAKRGDIVELPPRLRDTILAGLRGVTSSTEGTAYYSFAGFPLDQFPVAGKTGTAQVFRKSDTALFAAFAPADAPRFTVAVVLEESGFGSAAAAPVARRVLEVAFGLDQPDGKADLVDAQGGVAD